MAHHIIGLFSDSKSAGEAVAELKNKGYTKDISLVAKDYKDSEVDTHQIKQETKDGTAAGAATGAAMGAIAGLLTGAISFIIPGAGLVVLGPLAATLTGAAAGALTGGVVGTLVDMGIPDQKAKDYQDKIMTGEVLVAVTAEEDKEIVVLDIYTQYGATDTFTSTK